MRKFIITAALSLGIIGGGVATASAHSRPAMPQRDFPCQEDEVLAYGPESTTDVYCQNHEDYVVRIVSERLG